LVHTGSIFHFGAFDSWDRLELVVGQRVVGFPKRRLGVGAFCLCKKEKGETGKMGSGWDRILGTALEMGF
jgi:hypothetical protein